ncbi:ABC transporter substrate-binding protein [Virgibacillus dakarensis]|uniref:ABC transporter substrate-binding protein n=1 Tax=Lentibacillus populi TaxID=1827502 RepID=A0A9W5U071_9BACI|nr:MULTISPECIES: ABC transporter substrate-binding protein [Bacillaceae]MBT2217406.1 ABC transporter substrate-binding protein [Virgibacillus dakarensis]MTW87003.1 ABC transporter substrate-binding protein [Virgibacillus dakarensis]GGB55964.1 ABC transporter substrate-binding protein [Lentibacillus populi]
MKKFVLLLSTAILVVLSACSGSKADGDIDKIVLADAGWDSIRVHNSIAQTIIEEGYGIDTEVTSGSTAATFQGLTEGDIDVYMEVWTDNIKEIYNKALDKEEIEKVSVNFDDNVQGLYVPTYVIEGDKEKGIEPMAPDLKTVEDLKKYPELFADPAEPDKGRLINAPSGWAVEQAITEKMDAYGLNDTFVNFKPGSDAAIVSSLTDAINSGKAWVGYYWSPTAVTAKYDLTLLEEPEYDKEVFEETKATAFPPNDVVVAVNKDLPEAAPEVVDFLSNYETSSALTEEALKYMDENDASPEEAAMWWMEQHEDIWTSWVSEDIAKKVKESM